MPLNKNELAALVADGQPVDLLIERYKGVLLANIAWHIALASCVSKRNQSTHTFNLPYPTLPTPPPPHQPPSLLLTHAHRTLCYHSPPAPRVPGT